MRHQLRMPATDVAILTASIAAVLERRGKDWPALVEGHEGARGGKRGEAAGALLPEGDVVRVLGFRGMKGPDDAAQLEHLRDRFDVQPSKPDKTPALSLLVRPDAAVTAWLRPWRLRSLSIFTGGKQVVEALKVVSSDQRANMQARALQILLVSEILMGDAGAEFDDAALSLTADEGVLRLHAALSLTPEGEAIFEAAEKGAGEAFGVKVDDAWIDGVLRVDLRAALDATEVPPMFAKTTEVREVVEAMQEAGPMANAYLALRHPLGMLRVADQLAKGESLPISIEGLPTAVHVVWLGMADEIPKLAVAAQWPEDYSTTPLTTLALLARADHTFESLSANGAEREGKPITLFGLGGDPSEVFDLGKEADIDPLMQVRISLSQIGEAVAMVEPKLATLLMGDAIMTWDRGGRALVGELAWAPKGGEIVVAKVPVARRGSWDSPMGPAADAKGTACLSEAARNLSKGMGALSLVAPDEVTLVIAKVMSDAEAPLQCAAKDDATAEAAQGLRRMAVTVMAQVMIGSHQNEAALALLTRQCEESEDEKLCALSKAQAALPRPNLPEVELSMECGSPYGIGSGDIDVRVDAKGISVDGEAVEAASFSARLKAVLTRPKTESIDRFREFEDVKPEFPEEEMKPSVGLAVDGAVTMASLRPLLQTMLDAGVTSLVISVRGVGGGHSALAVNLAALPPSAPTGGVVPPAGEPAAGILGSLGASEDPSGTVFEVGKGKVSWHSVLSGERVEHSSPSVFTLRAGLEGLGTAFVYGADDATWKDMASTFGGLCPDEVLVLGLRSP